MRTYVFTDVHGCCAALNQALNWIAEEYDDTPTRIIGLGDYVDRGPDTARVINRLRLLEHSIWAETILLMGNHEWMMYEGLLGNRDALNTWLANGGVETLKSYGVGDISLMLPGDIRFPKQLSNDVEWMMNLPLYYEDEHRYYVHAGMFPGISLAEQSDKVLLWYRKPKDEEEFDYDKLLIHGHTPVKGGPEVHPKRINLDTGACFWKKGGCLTVARFIDDDPEPFFKSFTQEQSKNVPFPVGGIA